MSYTMTIDEPKEAAWFEEASRTMTPSELGALFVVFLRQRREASHCKDIRKLDYVADWGQFQISDGEYDDGDAQREKFGNVAKPSWGWTHRSVVGPARGLRLSRFARLFAGRTNESESTHKMRFARRANPTVFRTSCNIHLQLCDIIKNFQFDGLTVVNPFEEQSA